MMFIKTYFLTQPVSLVSKITHNARCDMIGRVTRHSLYGTLGYGTGSLLKARNLVRYIALTLRGLCFS